MKSEYDWEEILNAMKRFTNVEDIDDIVLLGDEGGIRRIVVGHGLDAVKLSKNESEVGDMFSDLDWKDNEEIK